MYAGDVLARHTELGWKQGEGGLCNTVKCSAGVPCPKSQLTEDYLCVCVCVCVCV